MKPEGEHPDRVLWYQALIEEWTAQAPQVTLFEGEGVAAWVGPYSSSYGIRHPAATQAWAESREEALEALCNWVYADVEADRRMLEVLQVGVAV